MTKLLTFHSLILSPEQSRIFRKQFYHFQWQFIWYLKLYIDFSAKSKGSICSLVKWADTAFWLWMAVCGSSMTRLYRLGLMTKRFLWGEGFTNLKAHLDPAVLVVIVRWATWLILASASPRNPYVAIAVKSSNFCSLLVVNRSHTMSISSFWVDNQQKTIIIFIFLIYIIRLFLYLFSRKIVFILYQYWDRLFSKKMLTWWTEFSNVNQYWTNTYSVNISCLLGYLKNVPGNNVMYMEGDVLIINLSWDVPVLGSNHSVRPQIVQKVTCNTLLKHTLHITIIITI